MLSNVLWYWTLGLLSEDKLIFFEEKAILNKTYPGGILWAFRNEANSWALPKRILTETWEESNFLFVVPALPLRIRRWLCRSSPKKKWVFPVPQKRGDKSGRCHSRWRVYKSMMVKSRGNVPDLLDRDYKCWITVLWCQERSRKASVNDARGLLDLPECNAAFFYEFL